MVRRLLLGAVASLGLLAAAPPVGATDGSHRPSAEVPREFSQAASLATLFYDPALGEVEFLDRVGRDAEALGFDVARTFSIGNAVVLRGSVAEVLAAVRAAESLPVRSVGPAYAYGGVLTPDSLMAVSNRLLLAFPATATETAKESFYRAHGLERVRELANGEVVVRSGQEPSMAMVAYANGLASDSPLLLSATPEFLLAGQPTVNTNSIQITDPYFETFQWHLWNTPSSLGSGAGQLDADIDVPRAWMINRMGAASLLRGSEFGFSGVTASVFDSGIQTSHEELSAAINQFAPGFDAVDGGAPLPSQNLSGAHGTAMAGLISAQINGRGIVGVAPGVRLYASRVFGQDYSTSNVQLSSALQDSINKDVDVNVHPYSLPTVAPDSTVAGQIDLDFRRSIESGRGGFGTPNIASTGNFSAQVEYPSSSIWTFAVGAVSAANARIGDANWGGTGVDFVMPAFSSVSVGAGFVVTDLAGRDGISPSTTGFPGNELGNFGGLGTIGFPRNSAADSSFLGTSVSAALAGGLVALLYSDSRFDELPPFNLEAVAGLEQAPNSRRARRLRAPLRPNDNSILAVLKGFSDLPGTLGGGAPNPFVDKTFLQDLSYVEQVDEFLGFGRPNAARLLAVPAGLPSPDSGYESAITDFLQYTFVGGIEPINREEVYQTWEADQNDQVAVFLTATDADPTIISPAFDILGDGGALYFEDGTTIPGPLTVLSESVPLTPTGSDTLVLPPGANLLWNPEGTYLSGRRISVVSPRLSPSDIPTTYSLLSPGVTSIPPDVPMLLTLQMAHELGVENVSFVSPLAGTATSSFREIDPIIISVTYFPEDPDAGVERTTEIGRITGDSSGRPKQRLETAVSLQLPSNGPFVAAFRAGRRVPGPIQYYFPWIDADQMIIRPYTFLIPPVPSGFNGFSIKITLDPGASYLPTWRDVPVAPNINVEQVHAVRRDMRGFLLYSAKFSYFDPSYIDYLNQTEFILGDGIFATWSPSQSEVQVVQPPGNLTALELEPYIDDPATRAQGFPRRFVRHMSSGVEITGLKSHPSEEILAITASRPDGSGGGLATLTNDGVNFTEVVPVEQALGARHPSWSPTGNQLVFSGPSYVRIVNFVPGEGPKVETIIAEGHPFLTDFRHPVFDKTAGLVIFSARRIGLPVGNNPLQLYVATRNGRIFGFRADAEGNALSFLRGWENVDIYDLDSFNGGAGNERLVFTANASTLPVYDPDSGDVVEPAQPGEYSRLFILENLNQVTIYPDVRPVVTSPTLVSQLPDGELYSARWGRISPNGQELAWSRIRQPTNSSENNRIGAVVRQQLLDRDFVPNFIPPPPDPPPSVTPVPPTPGPPDNSRIVLTSDIEFAGNENGWKFNSGGFTENPALARYESIDGVPKDIAPGIIGLYSGSLSVIEEQNALVATVRFQARRAGTATFTMLTAPPRTTEAEDEFFDPIPTIVGASASVKAAPRGVVDPVRVFAEPASQQITTGQIITVRIRMDPNGNPVQALRAYMSYDAELLFYESGSFNTAIFNRPLSDGALVLAANNSNNVFGFWGSPESLIDVIPDALYLFRARVAATVGTPPSQVPTVRLRVNSRTFESAFTQETNSLGDLSLSPAPEDAKTVDLLFRPPAGLFTLPIEDQKYLLSFDLLNFLPDKSPNGGLVLDDITLYRFDEFSSWYSTWGFEVPPGNPATVTFTANSTAGVESEIAIAVTDCCFDSSGQVGCDSGTTRSGVRLDSLTLSPGFYTVVVSTSNKAETVLGWTSTRALLPNLGDACAAPATRAVTNSTEACALRVPISGATGSSFGDNPFYDGRGFFSGTNCDPTPVQSVIKNVTPIYEALFSDIDARADWDQGPADTPFTRPVFGSTADALTISTIDRNQTFGFWSSQAESIPLGTVSVSPASPVAIYRATFRVVNAGEGNALSVPDIRLRLATNEFQRSVSAVLVARGQGVVVPRTNSPREVEVYMVLEEVPASLQSLIAAFDILAFYPESEAPSRTVTSEPIELEWVRIERVDIPNYPSPR